VIAWLWPEKHSHLCSRRWNTDPAHGCLIGTNCLPVYPSVWLSILSASVHLVGVRCPLSMHICLSESSARPLRCRPGDGLEGLGALSLLRSLNLSNMSGLADGCVAQLAPLRALTSLILDKCSLLRQVRPTCLLARPPARTSVPSRCVTLCSPVRPSVRPA
jgi:hypothetical protein